MSNHVQTEPSSDVPASAERAGDASVNRQRAALSELLALSAQCARREQEIDAQHERAASEIAAQRSAIERQTSQRITSELNDAATNQVRMLQEIDARRDRAVAQRKGAADGIRRQIDHDTESTGQDLKQQLQHAVWLADSLLEGAQAHARQEHKKIVEQVQSQLETLGEMDQRARELMRRYRQAPPADDATTGDAPQAPSASHAAQTLRDQQENVAQSLRKLGMLSVPKFFIGGRPFVIPITLCIAAAVAAQAFSGGLPPRDGMGIQWKIIGLAAGGAMAASLLLAMALWAMARSSVASTYRQLHAAMAAARQAAEAHVNHSSETRHRRISIASQHRDNEVQTVRNSVTPKLQGLAHKRNQIIASAESELSAALTQINQQHGASLAELKQRHEDEMSNLKRAHHEQLAAATQRIDQRAAGIEQQCLLDRAELERRWSDGLARIQSGIDSTSSGGTQAPADWSRESWQQWNPPSTFAPQVRFGRMQVDVRQLLSANDAAENAAAQLRLSLPDRFSVPALLAFPRQASMLIQTDAAGRAAALRTLQMVMTRLLTSVPAGRVRFIIIDPVGLGQNFAGFMHLADHDESLVGTRIWTDADHIEQRLRDLTEHMETVIQKYLRNEYETIDDYNAQAGELAEPYRFLVIADFPTNFSPEAIRRLNSIASAGARCGVYTLVMRDLRQPLPGGTHLDELEQHSVNLVRHADRFVWKDEVLGRFPLTLDDAPDEPLLTQILDVVGRGAKDAKRVELPFESIAPASDDQYWSGDCTDELRIPIGRAGATRLQLLRLGRGVAQHALIAGKTGSGKSTLLHVLVTNLALWYRPDEVEFYLVDFKKGVEFKTYATHLLPHARAIAVESDREFGLSVLHRVDAEMTRRGTLFRDAGVQDIAAYRRAADVKMPRVLLIIDEFQEFFSEDDRLSQDAALLLDRLVRQGRAFGIHLLLGSQTIGGTSGLPRSTIGQMAVRIALQTSEADAQLILGDNNTAARLLSRPGEAIYNDAGGLIEGNSPFQVAWLSDESRERCLVDVAKRARDAGNGSAVPLDPPIVFEGNVPADVRENRPLAQRTERPPRDGDSPPAAPRAYLGQPVAIKDPTHVVLRRQSGANVLMVGQSEESAMAIMACSLVSLASQYPTHGALFYVLDGSPGDSTLHGALHRVTASLPQQSHHVEWRAVPDAIDRIAQEVQRRQETAAGADAPATFVFIYGLQRYRVLRKQEESFNFSSGDEEKRPRPDRQLADILRDGAALGVHVIAWADTLASVERTLDRNSLREFDHRVLFQMSANDSSNLIDSPAANKLGFHRALAFSEEQGAMEKFRPYALPDTEWLESLGAKLKTK